LVDELEAFGHLAEHLTEEAAQLVFTILKYQRQLSAQGSDTSGHHNSVLTKQATDFIGQRRAPLDELEANSMKCLDVLLGCTLGTNRIEGRPTASQIAAASLPSFFGSCDTAPQNVGSSISPVAELFDLARPVVSAGARLHTD
jgi:hypothetical protein